MSRENFNPQVGDLVRFREWEDMLGEFGTHYGDIECKFSFTTDMKHRGLCGTEFVIERISSDGRVYGHGTVFAVSIDMLEYAIEESFDTEEIDKFLGEILVKES